eukprot:scaffold3070_cov133-Isochrysis_galbana.AAC.3
MTPDTHRTPPIPPRLPINNPPGPHEVRPASVPRPRALAGAARAGCFNLRGVAEQLPPDRRQDARGRSRPLRFLEVDAPNFLGGCVEMSR